MRAGRWIESYRIVSRAYFHLPLVAVFLLMNGYQPLQIAFMLALYGVVAALADLGLGWLKGRLTLAGSLVVGESIKVVGLLLMVVDVQWGFVAASQILSGVGFSLTAGVDGALASSLRGRETAAAQESRTQMGMFLISFAAAVLGAFALLVWDRLPFLLSALAALVSMGLVLAARLPLRDSRERTAVPRSRGRGPGVDAKTRFWAMYYSLNRALLLSSYTFLIPLLLFGAYRISIVLFGVLMGIYTLLGLVAARLSPRLAGKPVLFVFSSVGLVLGIALLLGDGAVFAACALAALGISGGFVRPATMISLTPALERVDADQRVRILRGLERNQGLLQAVLLLASGVSLTMFSSIEITISGYLAICVILQIAAGVVFMKNR